MALDHQAFRDVFDQYCRWPPMSSPEPGVFIDDGVDPLSVAVVAAIQAADPGTYQDDGPPTCWICDGAGHGFVLGWEYVPGKGDVPILSSPCPLEDRAGYGCGFLEADELLRDLELARDALDDRGAIGPLAGVETQVIRLHRKLGFDEGGLL
jgi:hypothetical protein